MNEIKKELINSAKEKYFNELKRVKLEFKPSKEIDGYGAGSIVGEKNYPLLNIYNVSNPEKKSCFLNDYNTVKKDYDHIIKLKVQNIFSSNNSIHIKKINDNISKNIVDIYKSKNPVNFTSEFEKEIEFKKINISKFFGILGGENNIKSITLNQNSKTSKQIEKFTENDIKSKDAMISLYKKGINESQIINLLALGQFGVGFNRKLVPSKWANTAYDKNISDFLYDNVIRNKFIENIEFFDFSDKGNHFFIFLFPNEYCFENIEMINKNKSILIDFNNFQNKLIGKTDPDTAGGFFATKLAILEYLNFKQKQASIVSIRLIDNYEIPLGVIFIRECIRSAMKINKKKFVNIEELFLYLKNENNSIFDILSKSCAIKNMKSQKRITEYIR